MAGNLELIPFGGTLLMKDLGKGYEPHYSLADVARHGGTTLDALGFHGTVTPLPYPSIDSIDFDIDTHYPALREAVLSAIRAGRVPVVAGGTDTLKFYASLLAADMRQLQAQGVIRELPPILVVSSMHAFDDAPDHVFRLLSAARVAADEAVIQHRDGVFALVPEDKEVRRATLLSLDAPVDKRSGVLTQAFVGADALPIDPDTPKHGKPLPHYDARRHPGPVQVRAFAHRRVAPPLEATEEFGLAMLFNRLADNNARYGFDAVIVKLPLEECRDRGERVAPLVARLRGMGVDVLLVNDPVADRTGTLVAPRESPDARNAAASMVAAGAIRVEGASSAQVYAQALLCDEKGAPAYFGAERKAAEARAETYRARQDGQPSRLQFPKLVDRVGTPKVVGIEYVPDAAAYDKMLGMLAEHGTRRVVSVNCSDGAMASRHVETLGRYPELKVTCSFKYAGARYPGMRLPETAGLNTYKPSRAIAALPNVEAGGNTPPQQLMRIHRLMR